MSNYKESLALGEVTWEYCKKSGTGGFWGWVRGAVGDACGTERCLRHGTSCVLQGSASPAALPVCPTEIKGFNITAEESGQVGIVRSQHFVWNSPFFHLPAPGEILLFCLCGHSPHTFLAFPLSCESIFQYQHTYTLYIYVYIYKTFEQKNNFIIFTEENLYCICAKAKSLLLFHL